MIGGTAANAFMLAQSAQEGSSEKIGRSVARLVSVQQYGSSFEVSVPVLYPSGASSVVDVQPNGDVAFVSDMGVGHMEAEFGGASDYYSKQAREVAKQFGVGYDGYSVFALRVPMDRLDGAISVIANASVRAASAAILKAVEDKERQQNDAVFERVRETFGPQHVAKTVDVQGRHGPWKAHNVVQFPNGGRAAFEFVRGHRGSISSKFLMFSDLVGRLSLNAVVESRIAMPPSGAMLEEVANVIELNADNDDYRRAAQMPIAS